MAVKDISNPQNCGIQFIITENESNKSDINLHLEMQLLNVGILSTKKRLTALKFIFQQENGFTISEVREALIEEYGRVSNSTVSRILRLFISKKVIIASSTRLTSISSPGRPSLFFKLNRQLLTKYNMIYTKELLQHLSLIEDATKQITE